MINYDLSKHTQIGPIDYINSSMGNNDTNFNTHIYMDL